jgi:hypothetical protein
MRSSLFAAIFFYSLSTFAQVATAPKPPAPKAAETDEFGNIALDKEDHAKYVILLLYSLERIETVFKAQPETDIAKNALVTVRYARERINNPEFKIWRCPPDRPGAIASIVSKTYKDGKISNELILNIQFTFRYFNDPILGDGIVLHEFQHLYDLEHFPPDDPRNRNLRTKELRAFNIEANYLRIRAQEAPLSEEAKSIEEAFRNGENTPESRAFIDVENGLDYELLDRFEKIEYGKATELTKENVQQFLEEFVVPLAEEVLKDAKYLEEHKALLQEANPKADELKEFNRHRYRVESYRQGLNQLFLIVRAKVPEPSDEARAVMDKWRPIDREIYRIRKEIYSQPDALKKLGMMEDDRKFTEEGMKNFKVFVKWTAENNLDPAEKAKSK